MLGFHVAKLFYVNFRFLLPVFIEYLSRLYYGNQNNFIELCCSNMLI